MDYRAPRRDFLAYGDDNEWFTVTRICDCWQRLRDQLKELPAHYVIEKIYSRLTTF